MENQPLSFVADFPHFSKSNMILVFSSFLYMEIYGNMFYQIEIGLFYQMEQLDPLKIRSRHGGLAGHRIGGADR